MTHAFLERWYQFRHQVGGTLWGKLAVAVGVGGTSGRYPADDIETMAKITGQGAASCFSCGFGETCRVGVPSLLYGKGVKITEEMIPRVIKQPEVLEAAVAAGKLLGERLRNGLDRRAVTQKMQQTLMQIFMEPCEGKYENHRFKWKP